MEKNLISTLVNKFNTLGFKQVDLKNLDMRDCLLIMKKQTLNINRAIALIQTEAVPEDFSKFLKDWRLRITKRVGFLPFFYVLGLQIVIICETSIDDTVDLSKYVDKVDNQWSIIQSIYLISTSGNFFTHARTWAQFVTGKYQNAIVECLSQFYVDRRAF
ncbi:MAG: hypothetical protein WC450_00100 [Candidatus Omnitrophota bacterium]|jgi:hypothetical protein